MPASATLRRSRLAFLRLSALKRARNSSKFCVAAVRPVELTALAREEPRSFERLPLRLGRKQHVQRRRADLERRAACRVEQQCRDSGVEALSQQQALTGRGSKRNRGDELRIVIAPGTLVGVRPAPIEDELAVRVILNKEWQRPREALVVACHDVAGLPRRTVADAAAHLERTQELVLQERTVARQGVPGRGVDSAQCREPFDVNSHASSVPVAAPSVEQKAPRALGYAKPGLSV